MSFPSVSKANFGGAHRTLPVNLHTPYFPDEATANGEGSFWLAGDADRFRTAPPVLSPWSVTAEEGPVLREIVGNKMEKKREKVYFLLPIDSDFDTNCTD